MNPQHQQPNPAAQITPPQAGLATPQGIQQLAQKAAGTAHLNAFELLHDVLYGQQKHAETSATGGNPTSGAGSGGGNKGTGAGGGTGFGVHSLGGAPKPGIPDKTREHSKPTLRVPRWLETTDSEADRRSGTCCSDQPKGAAGASGIRDRPTGPPVARASGRRQHDGAGGKSSKHVHEVRDAHEDARPRRPPTAAGPHRQSASASRTSRCRSSFPQVRASLNQAAALPRPQGLSRSKGLSRVPNPHSLR